MEEHHAVLGVHRAIDVAVMDDASAAGLAATIMPSFATGAAGWSDRFARMLIGHDKAGSLEEVYPSIDDALAQLAEVPPRHAWHGARRLHALAALALVSPAHAPDGSQAELVQGALAHVLADGASPERFHALLNQVGTLSEATWSADLQILHELGLLHSTYQATSGKAPCSGMIVGVDIDGDEEPATVLMTQYTHPELSVSQLGMVLDPSRWPSCPGFWCSMTEETPPQPDLRRFLETVASDCGAGWSIITRLDFCNRTFADGSAAVDYWRCDDQSTPADGLVVVDEGSILVEPTDPAGGPGVLVSTTKRIRFIEPMDGAQLAMTACALGWAGAGEQFIFGCVAPEPVG